MSKQTTQGTKGRVDFFYRIVFEKGEEKKVPYEWKPGEEAEYKLICSMVKGWGGIPLDVNWAKGTNSYNEALKTNSQ